MIDRNGAGVEAHCRELVLSTEARHGIWCFDAVRPPLQSA